MPTKKKITKRVALATTFAGTGAIAVGYASAFVAGGPPGWAAWLLALGIPASIGGVILLGAARGSAGVGRLWVPIAFVTLTLAIGFCLALGIGPTESADSVLWLGLPARAAILIYGIGLMPAIVLPLAYALTFETQTLSEEDVKRVVAMGRDRE
jgi:hypothetical protein